MATLNVGAMAARLGLDPSDFLDKMKGVQGFNGFASAEMARQWKKTGRDGQEGLRLIDEALGIHVARPVARIVSETFPALGKALGAILPGVAFSALGFAIFEFVEGISRKMDEAKKKQEEFRLAVEKVKDTVQNTADTWGLKIAEIEGRKSLAAIAAEGAVEARHLFEELGKAIDDVYKKRVAAGSLSTRVFGEQGLGEVFTTPSGKANEQSQRQLDEMRKKIDRVFADDQLHGTDDAMKRIGDEADAVTAKIATLQKQMAEKEVDPFKHPGLLTGKEQLAGLQAQADLLNEAKADEQGRQKWAGAKKDKDDADAAKIRAKELRSEIEARHRVAESAIAQASAMELSAAATGKGTAASIQATAAAEAQKKIQDQMAEAGTKYFSGAGNQKIADDAKYKAGQATDDALIREAALREQVSKSVAEYNRGIAEVNTRTKERVASLNEEAAGHGKVAAEQAKALAGLIPLEEKLQELKDLRASMRGTSGTSAAPAPAIGPPTLNQQNDADMARMSAELQGARANIEQGNSKQQAAAFEEVHRKMRDEIAITAAQAEGHSKVDAEIQKLTRDLEDMQGKVPNEYIKQLRQDLTDVANVKIAGEFYKLEEQIKLAAIETKALSSASPFAKLDAEAQKIGREFKMDASEIAKIRDGLIELQRFENVGKAWLSVDQLNASGAKMQELRQQMEALGRAARTGQTDDGTTLTPQAIAAVKLEMLDLAEEEDKILLKTGDIAAGFRAWGTEIQKVASAGEITFQALNQAAKGSEDTAINSLMAVMTAQRGEHFKLIHDLEKMWSQYFEGLAKMGMKQGLDQLLAPLGKGLTGAFGAGREQPKAPGLAPTSPGSLTGLGAFLPKPGATGAASLTSAGTMLHTAATALLSAATALRASAAGGIGGGAGGSDSFFGGGAGEAADAGAPIPFFAEGGDATPGSSFISGEAGAEKVDLDRSGGAHVTPLGASMGGGDTHQHFDMRGAVVTDDLMRRAEAASLVHASQRQMMAAMPAMQREINLRKRT